MSNAIEIRVPDIGDFKDVEVIEILVKPGDRVKKDDSLVALESDKATMEVPSSGAGVVKQIAIKVGDKVSEGTVIVTLEAEVGQGAATAAPAASTAAAAAPAAAPVARAEAPKAPAIAPPPPPTFVPASPGFASALEQTLNKPHASPSVRAFARELGVNLAQVKGNGPKGRILKEDVQTFVKGELAAPKATGVASGSGLNIAPMPQIDFSKFGAIETRALSRIKKISGANLHRNWVAIPHVTQHDEADITALEEFRKAQAADAEKKGVKLTPLAFLIKASVAALQQFPDFNSSLDGENLVLKKHYHIGFACDTPDGLVVPVIKDVNKKGILDIARELGELSQKAREKKISPADMQGGSFSISSLGGIGGGHFTPIINAPEVAILGAGRSAIKPVWQDGQWQPRLLLPLSLSYDHRVIDGAQGARFISYLVALLGDIRRVLL